MTVKKTAVIVLNLKLCMLFESLHKSELHVEHLQSEPPYCLHAASNRVQALATPHVLETPLCPRILPLVFYDLEIFLIIWYFLTNFY
jgi:hypothetical protein